MLKLLGFFFVTWTFVVGVLGAEKLNDLKQEYDEILKECIAQNPMTAEDVESLSKDKRTYNVNCIFACALKKGGMMDDDGNLSVEGVRKSAEAYLSDDPELLKKSELFTDACKSVNDAPVSDGKKGCDRASLIFQCSVEKAPSFQLF
uniref:Odorant-binding protein 5 n=1 Tax=Ectropis obliqua TaxID=248899 RepID=A0A1L2BLA0_ECTOB|nr:odorant-binding protein 5 [Ectropis obliqua]